MLVFLKYLSGLTHHSVPKKHWDLRQAYPWICRGFTWILDA